MVGNHATLAVEGELKEGKVNFQSKNIKFLRFI